MTWQDYLQLNDILGNYRKTAEKVKKYQKGLHFSVSRSNKYFKPLGLVLMSDQEEAAMMKASLRVHEYPSTPISNMESITMIKKNSNLHNKVCCCYATV